MKSLEKNKGTIAAIGIFLLVILGYNMLIKPNLVSIPSEVSAVDIGEDLLRMARELSAVSIDRGIFSAPGFVHLRDFTAPIPDAAVGRPNPFNPIGQN